MLAESGRARFCAYPEILREGEFFSLCFLKCKVSGDFKPTAKPRSQRSSLRLCKVFPALSSVAAAGLLEERTKESKNVGWWFITELAQSLGKFGPITRQALERVGEQRGANHRVSWRALVNPQRIWVSALKCPVGLSPLGLHVSL